MPEELVVTGDSYVLNLASIQNSHYNDWNELYQLTNPEPNPKYKIVLSTENAAWTNDDLKFSV